MLCLKCGKPAMENSNYCEQHAAQPGDILRRRVKRDEIFKNKNKTKIEKEEKQENGIMVSTQGGRVYA